jgi:PAS domain S-box-containing protein
VPQPFDELMTMRRKKNYTLHDIETLLTYIPPFFILALIALLIAIAYTITSHRAASDIALLTQKQQHADQNRLDVYIRKIRKQINTDFSQVQERLKRSVHLLSGIHQGITPPVTLKKLLPFMRRIERNNESRFVIFDKDFTLWCGQEQLKKIENLIFNRQHSPTLLRITMMYILSQGHHSALSWENDLDKTIQLSYFEQTDDGLFLGAFSQVGDMRSITRQAFADAIAAERSSAPAGYHFWLYDHAQERIFNWNNRARWQIQHAFDSSAHHQQLSHFFLSVGIRHEGNIAQQGFSEIIIVIVVIVIIGIIMLLFSWLFSNLIKRVLKKYNLQLMHTNARLRRLKERYELAVIASNDGLWDTNFKTGNTFFSHTWLEVLGYRTGEINSFNAWVDLLHPDDRERIIYALDEHKRQKQAQHLVSEYRLRTRSGEYLWMLGRGKVFWDDDGQPLRLLVMSMDISEQKETSKKLEELVQKEVAKNQEKQKILVQQNKLAAMGEMIGSIAHQWRQPLNNITLILHFIRDNIDNEAFSRDTLAHYVSRAKKQIDFMSDTIDDFRSFYHPSKTKAPFDAAEAIDSTLSIMQAQLDKAEINILRTGETFTIIGYENEFRQAILNILANAKDAILQKQSRTPSLKGKIHIKFGANRITLYNNGGSVSPKVLERMFEPYFTTKFEDKGTGIGLYMTRSIIENNMDGTLVAKNRKRGIEFAIQFHSEKPPHKEAT